MAKRSKNILFRNGANLVSEILERTPQATKVFAALGISKINPDNTLLELSRYNKIPLFFMLKNLSRGGKWQIEELHFSSNSSHPRTTPLRTGYPACIKFVLGVFSCFTKSGQPNNSIKLARLWARAGLSVGLLDLDFQNPQIPQETGLDKQTLVTNQHRQIVPLRWYRDIKVVSLGNMIRPQNGEIKWRGPLLAKALEQLIHDTAWDNLDVLILHCPMNNSETITTLFQLFPPQQVVLIANSHPSTRKTMREVSGLCRKFRIKLIQATASQIDRLAKKILFS